MALDSAQAAARAIRAEFGRRSIVTYKGSYDVQLRADLVAQREIIDVLRSEYPDHGFVSEEGMQTGWLDHEHTWVIDPLDGTNNFGYGIAHCATSMALFAAEEIVLALVFDPMLERQFVAVEDAPPDPMPTRQDVPLHRASVSLVVNYSAEGRARAGELHRILDASCKRVLSMWAPALDLALVSDGSIDAMVCHEANFIDVCAGIFLVQSAGGVVLHPDGSEFQLKRSMYDVPLTFVAARGIRLARELLRLTSR